MKAVYLLAFVLLAQPVLGLQTEIEPSVMTYVYFDMPESQFIDTYVCDYNGSQCIAYLKFDLQDFMVKKAELMLEIENIKGSPTTSVTVSSLKQPINDVTWHEVTKNIDNYKKIRANITEGTNIIQVTGIDLKNGLAIITEEQNQVKRIKKSSLKIIYEPVRQECELISAEWAKAFAVEGQTVKMIINSKGCLGKQATIRVYENGLFFDQQVYETTEIISNNKFEADWIIMFLEKLLDKTDYYFTATIGRQSKSSGTLSVKPLSEEIIESKTPYEKILEIKNMAKENEFLATKLCNEFESEHTRDTCFKRLGEETAKLRFCRRIKSDAKRDACLLNIFLLDNKFSCDEISDKQLATNCYFIYLLQRSGKNASNLLDFDLEQELQKKKVKFSLRAFIPLAALIIILLIIYYVKRGRRTE
ncbi:hypothetical protein D6745_05225 [Candidatus Woesearchaeota archaeon]|nr:MAG: hypothetical protein D6745_05225 [Candidatus Woesearchaeota archaeon]